MSEAPQFSALTKHKEVLREIGQRENLYPRWIASGKLRQETADRRLAIMYAIAADYAALHAALFGEVL